MQAVRVPAKAQEKGHGREGLQPLERAMGQEPPGSASGISVDLASET